MSTVLLILLLLADDRRGLDYAFSQLVVVPQELHVLRGRLAWGGRGIILSGGMRGVIVIGVMLVLSDRCSAIMGGGAGIQ